MLSFDEVTALLRDAAQPLERTGIDLADADGLVLGEDVTARLDSPRADVSAMDGYAVREADLPGPFRVVGTSSAGSPGTTSLAPGEAMRIFTGAHLPKGADRVLVQEIVESEGPDARIVGEYGDNLHVRRRGSDYREGQILLREGTCIDYRNIVLLAGADRAKVMAWRRPRIAILSTGDELAWPGTAHETPGTLPESVSFGIAALARQWGAELSDRRSIRDDPSAIAGAAENCFERSDVLVTIGGASVGERDFAQSSIAGGGFELLFAKAAIRPGKPIWAAKNADSKYVIGLPGNPTSAMVTARLFLAPLLTALAGRRYDDALHWFDLPLGAALPAPGGREHFARGYRQDNEAIPLTNQQSSSQATLARSDLLIRQAANSEAIPQGGAARCLSF